MTADDRDLFDSLFVAALGSFIAWSVCVALGLPVQIAVATVVFITVGRLFHRFLT